jgi:hypothetical protein
MPGLVPGIHVFSAVNPKTWMAGTSPAMTSYLVPPTNTGALAIQGPVSSISSAVNTK